MPDTPIIAGPASALTPNRETTVTLDITETVLQEEAWGSTRMYGDVAPLASRDKGSDGRFAGNMHFWACGVWTLRPVQMDISHLEKVFPELVYQKADF